MSASSCRRRPRGRPPRAAAGAARRAPAGDGTCARSRAATEVPGAARTRSSPCSLCERGRSRSRPRSRCISERRTARLMSRRSTIVSPRATGRGALKAGGAWRSFDLRRQKLHWCGAEASSVRVASGLEVTATETSAASSFVTSRSIRAATAQSGRSREAGARGSDAPGRTTVSRNCGIPAAYRARRRRRSRGSGRRAV